MKNLILFMIFLVISLSGFSQENRIKVKTQNDIPAHYTTNPLSPKLEGQRIIPRRMSLYIFSETVIEEEEYVIVKIGSQRGVLKVSEEFRVRKNLFYLVKKEDLVRSTSPVNKKLQISSTSERYYWETLSDIHVYECNFSEAGLPEAEMGERDWLPEGTGFVTVGKLTQAIPTGIKATQDQLNYNNLPPTENVYIVKLVNYKHEKNLDKAQREILYTKFAQFSVDPYGVAAKSDLNGAAPGLTKFYYIKDEILEDPYTRKVYEIGKNSTQLSFGALSVPIKLRLGNRKNKNDDPDDDIDDIDFDISTDFSIGPYVGARWRINKVQPWYFTVGGSFALTFVSINSELSTPPNQKSSPENIAAITLAFAPALFEFDKFMIGTAFGIDIVGKDNSTWTYNKKPWFSLAIGFDFLKPKEEK